MAKCQNVINVRMKKSSWRLFTHRIPGDFIIPLALLQTIGTLTVALSKIKMKYLRLIRLVRGLQGTEEQREQGNFRFFQRTFQCPAFIIFEAELKD